MKKVLVLRRISLNMFGKKYPVPPGTITLDEINQLNSVLTPVRPM